MRVGSRNLTWFAVVGATSCATIAGLDDFSDDVAGGGSNASGGSAAGGGADTNSGGFAGAGGEVAVSWGLTIEGEALALSVAAHPATAKIWVTGLYRSLQGLPPPPGDAWGSFIARFSTDGSLEQLEVLATEAGTYPSGGPVYDPDAEVFVVGDQIVVGATSRPNGSIPRLRQSAHAGPYVAWGTFEEGSLNRLSFAQACELSVFVKGLSLGGSNATSTPRAWAVASGGGDVSCSDAAVVSLQSETVFTLDAQNPSDVTPLSNVVGVRSAPSIAVAGETRLITGHFDFLSHDGTEFCGNGLPPAPSCALQDDFGAFALSLLSSGGREARYVGSIHPTFGGNLGTVRAAAYDDELFVAFTERAATQAGGAREVHILRYVLGELEPRFRFDTPTDEVATSLAMARGRTVVIGAVGQVFDPVRSLGGVVADHTDHSAGCPDDAADIFGDVFWLLLDETEKPIDGAVYGDCSHQVAFDADFDADGSVVMAGRFLGTMATPGGETLTASSDAGSLFVYKVAQPGR